ncbi:MAG: hypothetical protein HKP60_04535, partial [Eudoraea sp.]|nr:hypothetical protein [Eudoraea sp.]NNJ40121.1 hypothetical protein [Eudoraea sp.]
ALETNRENRPFLDKIYRELAVFYANSDQDSLALLHYNKSIQATANIPQLNALNYEDLAGYYFDDNQYATAGAYYDSVLTNLPENTKKFRNVKKKRDNLEDVINYEKVVQYTDSVITLYEMPDSERRTYFENFIAELKEKEEAARRKEEARVTAGFAAFAETKGGKENKGKFYFYNITSLGYGKNDFINKWGERTLEDDWRWSNKNRIRTSEATGETDLLSDAQGGEELSDDQKYSVDFYISKIPDQIQVIDSLRKERNFANYQLGLIYKEKFKENRLAAEKLEKVLANNPEKRLILPSKYNLYKIYDEAKSPLATAMKERILTEHPDSRYAMILLNPQAVLTEATDSPEARYVQLYEKFKNQEFLQVITGAEHQINQFAGDPVVPKFEMLKANAIGRLQGFEDFKEALNYVALNYPNNPEGKKAQQMIAEQLPKLENNEFTKPGVSRREQNWKVVFPFKRANNEAALKLKKKLEKSIEDLRYKNVVSRDIYNLEDQFVVVHGFASRDFALGYVELLKNNKDYRIDLFNFVILSANYKVIQVHKNLDTYKDKMLTPKP